MLIHQHRTFMAAGDGTGGGGGAPEMVDVDLPGGVQIKMVKADADKVIAGRNALKNEARDAHEQLGRIKAEKDASETARVKAETQAQAAEAMKKGEVEKATELLTKTHREREAKIVANLRDKAIRAAVTAQPKIVQGAIDDIADQLKGRSRYDIDADAVVVLDEAGQPLKDETGKLVRVDAWLPEWLAKRPHYTLDSTPKGTGADGSGRKPAIGAKTITEKQVDSMSPMERAKFFEANPEAKVVG